MGLFLEIVAGGGALLFLLFCFHLFFAKTGNRLLNHLLIVPIMARVLQNVAFLLVNSGQLVNYPYVLKISGTLSMAVPGCFYLYIHCFLNDQSNLRKRDWLHFIIPFLAVLDSFYTWFYSDIDLVKVAEHVSENRQFFSTIKNGLFPAQFYYFGFHILFIAYLIFAWRELFESGILRKKNSIERVWLLTCMFPTTISQFVSISPLLFMKAQHSGTTENGIKIAILINCMVFLGLVTFMINHPQIMYGYLLVSKNMVASAEPLPKGEGEDGQEDPQQVKRLNLNSDQEKLYIEAMNSYMDAEKPFLNNKFQIMHLAHHLNIPAHHCSFIINNVIGKNFRDWVNSYRVKYFIDTYQDKAASMTIDGIAFESGFNSATTFYRAFKKETGMMPSAYFQKNEVEV